LIITDDTFTGLAAVEKIVVTENYFEKEFKERVQRPGKIAFTAILTNDSYKGLDQTKKVDLDVVEKAKKQETGGLLERRYQSNKRAITSSICFRHGRRGN